MEDTKMSDVLYDYYRKENTEMTRDFFGEEDIIIPHGTAGNQAGYDWRRSEFELIDYGHVYIAGISGMDETSFSSSGLYNGFQTSTPSWSNKIIDAEKSVSNPKDLHMCWAATDSNLMVQAGWIPDFALDEDQIFDLYRDSFKYGDSLDGNAYIGAQWFLTGQYDRNSILLDDCYPGTGGYFVDVMLGAFEYVDCDLAVSYSCSIIQNAIADLREGNAVGLRIAQSKWGENDRGHFITLQGYTYEIVTEGTVKKEKITGIIIADSNDDDSTVGYGGMLGSSLAPNVLQLIPVHYILGDIYLDWNYMNYMMEGWSPWRMTTEVRVKPADFVTLSSGGSITCQGATLVSETLKTNEAINVSANGLAMKTNVSSGGILNISYGGMDIDTEVLSNGVQNVFHGGIASNTVVFLNGVQNVSPGGITSNTTVFIGGIMNVSGVADRTAVRGGVMNIISGGMAEMTTMIGGVQNVSSLGIAYKTSVSAGCIVNVSSDGFAMNTSVFSGGSQMVLNGGAAIDTTVCAGGSMIISSGGKTTGRMTFDNTAIVSACNGGIVDFNISNPVPANAALVNNLSVVQGTPVYTLTVSQNTASGLYRLADGASNFEESITVKNANGTTMGTLNVSVMERIGGVSYLLDETNGHLAVSVIDTPMKAPEFFNGSFSGGDTIFAAQSGNTVYFYTDETGWDTPLSLGTGWEALGAGDFDGDGATDVLRINSEGYVVGEMSEGDGTFSQEVLNALGTGWSVVGIGDFNHNGHDDVLVANPTGASETVGLIGYWESGTTWNVIDGYLSGDWWVVGTGDFNGDGKCDILWKGSELGTGGQVSDSYHAMLVGVDPNVQNWIEVEETSPALQYLCSGDFDGDGTTDVALIDGTGEVNVWGVIGGEMVSSSVFNSNEGIDTSVWSFAGVADFNGDGTDDIAWCNRITGQVSCWEIEEMEIADTQTLAYLA